MKSIIQPLNQILANSLVMFVKLHNYHWNIKGLEFYNLHTKTEEMYNYFGELYDQVAERILQLEGVPIVRMQDALDIATLEEESETSFSPTFVLKKIYHDYQIFHSHFLLLSQNKDVDSITESFAEDQLVYFEKEMWMLRSSIH